MGALSKVFNIYLIFMLSKEDFMIVALIFYYSTVRRAAPITPALSPN